MRRGQGLDATCAHWIRHTTLTWVERKFELAIARAFAGHSEPASTRSAATFTDVRPSLVELAEAGLRTHRRRHPSPADTGTRWRRNVNVQGILWGNV
jgi:hypothetical protein